MRIVPRESVTVAKVMRLAGSERPVDVVAVIDVNGRVKVSRVIDVDGSAALAKPRTRFAIISESQKSSSRLPS